MHNSVKKSLPLALAVLLAMSGAVFAGENASAVISLSKDTVSGIGAGESFDVTVSAAGITDVKNLFIQFSFDPASAIDYDETSGSIEVGDLDEDLEADDWTTLPPIAEPDAGTIEAGAACMSGCDNLTDSAALPIGAWKIYMAEGYDGSEVTVQLNYVQLGHDASDYNRFYYGELPAEFAPGGANAGKATGNTGLKIIVNPPEPPPSITSVVPAEGPTAGGTAVTITGENFQDGATVTIGGAAAAVTFVDATTLNAISPAGSVGGKEVVVTNPDGSSATWDGTFEYLPFSLSGDPFPHPATMDIVHFPLQLDADHEVALRIFNLDGGLVHETKKQFFEGTNQRLSWEIPEQIVYGLYFYQLTVSASASKWSGKIAIMR